MTTPAPSKADLRARLSPLAYHVTQEAGTERAFTGPYWNAHDDGAYHCVVCDALLFDSREKFDSGTGWPSYWAPAKGAQVEERRDSARGLVRTEVTCGRCAAHLGHVFDDGPPPTRQRYCINGVALSFRPR